VVGLRKEPGCLSAQLKLSTINLNVLKMRQQRVPDLRCRDTGNCTDHDAQFEWCHDMSSRSAKRNREPQATEITSGTQTSRAGISTSEIHFIISKPVSAFPADATEVPTSRHKSSSTNGLAATGPQSGSNFKKKFSENIYFFSPPLRREKYAESIGEIRFQIRSQSREIFAFL